MREAIERIAGQLDRRTKGMRAAVPTHRVVTVERVGIATAYDKHVGVVVFSRQLRQSTSESRVDVQHVYVVDIDDLKCVARRVVGRARLPVIIPSAGYDGTSVFGSALLIIADFELGGGPHAPPEGVTGEGEEECREMDRGFRFEFPVIAPTTPAIAAGKGLVRTADSCRQKFRAPQQVAMTVTNGRGEAQITAGVGAFKFQSETLRRGGCGNDGRLEPYGV